MKHLKLLIVLLILFGITACREKQLSSVNQNQELQKLLPEINPLKISLQGEISNRNSEISGLAWYKENLILLPQFPNKWKNGDAGTVYSISKKQLINYINGKLTQPILPQKLKFFSKGLEQFDSKGSGYEAILFDKNDVYISIESFSHDETDGFVVKGTVSSEDTSIVLDANTLRKIPLNINLFNSSCETILNFKQNIVTIFEANGKNINPNPLAYEFDNNLSFIKFLPFPTIEYRITDATSVDENGKFWAMNYFYPGDKNLLNPAEDSLKLKFGYGKTHFLSEAVERIVQLKISEDKIVETNIPPIYLKLDVNNPSRNWEGLAKLDDLGFLIVTDKYPETILAFVRYP